jgi:hypothetical protein
VHQRSSNQRANHNRSMSDMCIDDQVISRLISATIEVISGLIDRSTSAASTAIEIIRGLIRV